jgi:hypothetical protein
MPPVGFDPTIPAIERPQTNAVNRAATGIGTASFLVLQKPPEIKFTLNFRFRYEYYKGLLQGLCRYITYILPTNIISL